MSARRHIAPSLLCLLLQWTVAQAAVTGLVVTERKPFGTAGGIDYEWLSGTYRGELDPADRHNAIINDIALAPRNARGRVEYSATFAIVKPVDMARASGVLFYDTPNRSLGFAAPDPDGHVHVLSGWQGDIPPMAGRQTAQVPVARQRNGQPLVGPVLVRWVDVPDGTRSVPLQGGLVIPVDRPEPASLDTRRARLVRRSSDADAGEIVRADRWAFADCSSVPFPGKPDAHKLCLQEGFDARHAYELTYTAKDPPVLGIGFAAVRDLVSALRHAPARGAVANPLAGAVRHTIITGVSQSGNFVRTFIHLGFNADEGGAIVFDGAHPQIAARLVPMNFRFALPGGAATLYEPGSEGVLWWGRNDDRARGRGVTSLLTRCSASGTCPKVVESFGATEFWGLRMSPDLVGIDARADIPLPANVRRYYFPGVTHGGGQGGFATDTGALPKAQGCTLPGNPNPTQPQVRALNAALVAWVVNGTEPPPSRYPTLSAGELVPPSVVAASLRGLPGVPDATHLLNEFLVYDFGRSLHADDLSGSLSRLPPRITRTSPSLVVKVDADGNEVAGAPSVQHQVPLGTYLGWNEQASGYYAGTGCGFQGGFVPFARTRAEREANGDRRPSLEERYGSHAGFVARVREAADRLVAQRLLLRGDADAIVAQAEASTVLRDRGP